MKRIKNEKKISTWLLERIRVQACRRVTPSSRPPSLDSPGESAGDSMPQVAITVRPITPIATLAMKAERVGSSSRGSRIPSRERRLMLIRIAPTTMPTVSMHQITPTARDRSSSLVRSITRAR